MNFIYGLKVIDFISRLIKIYYDNLATVFFFKNNKSEAKIRITTHYFIMRKKIKEYEVIIKHISTNLIITNPMT
jgi:hypothetical protein